MTFKQKILILIMLYDYPLNCPMCGKKPKLIKGLYNYVKYYCPHNSTFHHRKEEFAREAWNATVQRGIDKIKVKI